MNTDHGHDSGEARNPSVEYDKSDLGARGILIFFLVLLVSVVAAHLGVLGLYVGLTKVADQHAPETSPLAPKTVTPRAEILTNTADVNIEQFPQPRLLTHIRGPAGEMSKFLLQEAAALTAQPWQDAQGNVHLPIGQAMKMVVPRLPVRAGATALPNYPGAGQEYSYPTAPVAAEQSEVLPSAADQSAAEQQRIGEGR